MRTAERREQKERRQRRLLLSVLLLASVSSVPSVPSFAAVRNPDTFVYAIVGDADSLDPHWAYDTVSYAIQTQVYETLVFFKGASTRELEPMLAAKLPSVSADGRTYRFEIRKGVTFHDGGTLTPADVKYSLMRFCLSDRDGGPSALLLEPLTGRTGTRENGKAVPAVFGELDRAIQVDGDAVVVTLKQPYAPLLSILAGWGAIVSKPFAVAHGEWDGTEKTWTSFNGLPKEASYLHEHVDGTGPFRLERWDRANKQVVLSRFDGYWRAPAKLKALVFKTVDEFSGRRLLLSGGDADAIMPEREYQAQLASLPGVSIVDDLPNLEITNVFIFNFAIDPTGNPFIGSGKLDGAGIPPAFFSDPEVRKGVASAFDYDAYIRDGYRGKAAQARGPIPRIVPGYNAAQPVRRFDPKEAEAHLRKAQGGRLWETGFTFALTYQQGKADRQLACQILKHGLESLNPKFHVDVRPMQWSTYLSDFQARKLPMANGRWGMDYPDAHNCVSPFLHSRGYYAAGQRYKNAEADRLIEAAVREGDAARRAADYAALQKIAFDDVPSIFTVDVPAFRAQRAWVRDWDSNPLMPFGYFYRTYKDDTAELMEQREQKERRGS